MFVPSVQTLLAVGFPVAALLEATAEHVDWWLRQIKAAEKAFFADLGIWLSAAAAPVEGPSPALFTFQCATCGFTFRKHLHAHVAKSHQLYGPARHFAFVSACVGTVEQTQLHLKRTPACLRLLAPCGTALPTHLN